MHTLHHAAEIRGIDSVDELELGAGEGQARGNASSRKQVIETFDAAARTWRTTRTSTGEGLQQIIDAKIAGEEVVADRRGDAARRSST